MMLRMLLLWITIGGLLSTSSRLPAQQSTTPVSAELQRLRIDFHDPQSEAAKDLRQMMPLYVRLKLQEANQTSSREWYGIKTRDQWLDWQRARIESLKRYLGIEDPPPSAPRFLVTGTLTGQGHRVENLVYESVPGFPVTANLYQPDPVGKNMPAILIVHSHHAPKTQGELQDMGVSWARAGCLVLVIDLPGHGQRRQHPFVTEEDYPQPFRPSRQDYYFRYNAGLQLSAAGSSLMALMVHDLRRGIDLLCARPGVDGSRVIVMGAVAGGGDPAAVTAAVDQRVAAAVPFNFGGPQPETAYPLPDNAEETFRYAGGGSWESTRNLQGSAAGGYLPWVIVGSIAPRRLIYGHEFVWDRERDPVWARLEKIYQWFDARDRLSFTHGRGRLSGRPPEASHCTNIGAIHREAIYEALARWFAIPPAKVAGDERRPAEDLYCLTEKARQQFDLQPLHQVALKRMEQRAADTKQATLLPAMRPMLEQRWASILGNVTPTTPQQILHKQAKGKHYAIDQVSLETEPGIVVPAVLLMPADVPNERRPVVIMVAQQGKQALLEARHELIAELLAKGIAVCLADLRGTGETRAGDGRGRSSSATSISSSLAMLGQTLLGGQVRDLRSVIAHLRSHPQIRSDRIALWGDSLAPQNDKETNFAVPLDAPRLPAQAEPMGAAAVLFATLFEKEIAAVYARGGLASYASLLASPFLYLPHDAVLPTAGRASPGDIRQLVDSLQPGGVRLESMVDGLNQRLDSTALERHFLMDGKGLKRLQRDWEPAVRSETSSWPELAQWLQTSLNR